MKHILHTKSTKKKNKSMMRLLFTIRVGQIFPDHWGKCHFWIYESFVIFFFSKIIFIINQQCTFYQIRSRVDLNFFKVNIYLYEEIIFLKISLAQTYLETIVISEKFLEMTYRNSNAMSTNGEKCFFRNICIIINHAIFVYQFIVVGKNNFPLYFHAFF